jgi:hypothetical protein
MAIAELLSLFLEPWLLGPWLFGSGHNLWPPKDEAATIAGVS